jgi:DNA polymerase III epsilon subunit-like protein
MFDSSYEPRRPAVSGSRSFVIFDLETTGLYPDSCEIIQIAALRFRDGQIVPGDTYFSYCRPSVRIPFFITEYTGVTEDDVRGAPAPIEVLAEFSRYVGTSTLMAHNGHRFDSRFLESTCARHAARTRPVASIDTISFSRRLFGNARGTGHSLDRVLGRLGLDGSRYRRHDARGDILALADSVSLMWSRLQLDADCSSIPRKLTRLPALPGETARGI